MEHKEYRKLHAEWYDLVSGDIDSSREIEFWATCIEESGGPALELGSGTGRVLIPLLERGYDVIGIDTSEDMMARCIAACNARGLKPELHEQSMIEFDLLPRTFGLIFLDSGGLGLFTADGDIHATFQRVMAHLEPGARFIFEFEPVQAGGEGHTDDGLWKGGWMRGLDNAIIAWRQQNRTDPDTHTWERLFIVEKFVEGRLVEAEANERTGRFFTVEEAVEFATSAGFEDVRATDWLSEEPPRQDSQVITVRCRKPA